MRHRDRVKGLKATHEELVEKIKNSDPNKLPPQVYRKKLEKTYELLKGYVFVLKKVE